MIEDAELRTALEEKIVECLQTYPRAAQACFARNLLDTGYVSSLVTAESLAKHIYETAAPKFDLWFGSIGTWQMEPTLECALAFEEGREMVEFLGVLDLETGGCRLLPPTMVGALPSQVKQAPRLIR